MSASTWVGRMIMLSYSNKKDANQHLHLSRLFKALAFRLDNIYGHVCSELHKNHEKLFRWSILAMTSGSFSWLPTNTYFASNISPS